MNMFHICSSIAQTQPHLVVQAYFFSFKGIYVLLFFFNDSLSGSRAEMLLSGCRQTLFGGVVNLH